MASQITNLTIVYSTFYSGADQRKHQSSASLAFVRGIHRWPVTAQRDSNTEFTSIWWRYHDIEKLLQTGVALYILVRPYIPPKKKLYKAQKYYHGKQTSIHLALAMYCASYILTLFLVLCIYYIDGLAKTAVTPLLTHGGYCSFALSHRYSIQQCRVRNPGKPFICREEKY